MANEVNINHAFVTAKPDSADDTLVSADEWNDELLVSGGSDGMSIVRDSTSPTGSRFVQGAKVNVGTGSYTGASPTTALGAVVITATSRVSFLFNTNVAAITSGGGDVQVFLRRNATNVDNFTIPGDGKMRSYTLAYNEDPGTFTYDITMSVGGGQTFSSSSVRNNVLTIGGL